MSDLRTIIRGIRKELKERDKVRESAHNDMRRATSLSKRSILLIHQKKDKEARKQLEEARRILSDLDAMSFKYPDVIFTGMFDAARQEYAEAQVFISLVEEKRFVTPEEIGVPSIDYVLGVADAIGEFRRVALDSLREGNVKKGEECLQTMDELYVELLGLDDTYVMVSGLRRKCDVARKIIEITRGDITQEVRRSALEKYLRFFEKRARKQSTREKA